MSPTLRQRPCKMDPPSWGVRGRQVPRGGGIVSSRRGAHRHEDRTDAVQKEQMMQNASVPTTDPVQVAPETFLIPNLVPAGEGAYLPVNSLLIRGEEPIVVDTG